MLNKIITIVLSVFTVINTASLSAFAQVKNNEQISLAEVELLLSEQKREFDKDIAFGVAGAATVIGGGIYAYYTQKQMNLLKKRNNVLSYKVSKLEGLVNSIAKDNATQNKKIAANTKVVKQNRESIAAIWENVKSVVKAVNGHTEFLNQVASSVTEQAGEGSAASAAGGGAAAATPKKRIGFVHYDTPTAEKKVKNLLVKYFDGWESVSKIRGKAGAAGLLIAGAVALYYVAYENDSGLTAISNKRVIFERSLKTAYDNDNGLFILDVFAHADNNFKLTASVLHESIATDKDLYSRFVKQSNEAKMLAKEAALKNDIASFSVNPQDEKMFTEAGLLNGNFNFANMI